MQSSRFSRFVSTTALLAYLNLAFPVGPLLLAAPLPAKPELPQPIRTSQQVLVNRQVPVSKEAFQSGSERFSSPPTVAEIFRARVFDEPFVPAGATPSPGENTALAAAITAQATAPANDYSAFTDFISEHPDSSWGASIQLNLGLRYFAAAKFSDALASYDAAWQKAKSVADPKGKLVADRALAELLQLYARLGRRETLETVFAEIGSRTFTGRVTELIAGAREGLQLMQQRPDLAFRCGPAALDRILAREKGGVGFNSVLTSASSTSRGMNLTEVWKLSKEVGLELQMAKRSPGAVLLSPAVIHWKLGHYAALFAQDGVCRLEDPTFRADIYASPATLDAEASGYFLVPVGLLPHGWSVVTEAEGREVWGKGNTATLDPDSTTEEDDKAKTCPNPEGMTVANAHLMTVSLNLIDIPVGYAPPVGPEVKFKVTYNQREASQPTLPDFSNIGSKWVHNWVSFIDEAITTIQPPAVYYTNPAPPPTFLSYLPPLVYVIKPTVRQLGGGSVSYPSSPQFSAPTQLYPASKAVRAKSVLSKIDDFSYSMTDPDGSVMIYGRRTGALGSYRFLLTQKIEASGQSITLSYDSYSRLVGITDALGQVTTLEYTFAADSLKITKVTDPFGRFASFEYDASARLIRITDVVGIVSQYSYLGASDFISSLTTPYGTSSFAYGESGPNGRNRWLEITDPLGDKQRVECRDEWPGIPDAPYIPIGMLGTTPGAQLYRNTLYWSEKAMKDAPGSIDSAHIYHYLHTQVNTASGLLENEKKPFENRTFYEYQGQTDPRYEGTSSNRITVGQAIDQGTARISRFVYNVANNVTKTTDPVGRETTYVYAANQIDIVEIRQKTGAAAGTYEILGKFTYNSLHRPLTATDVAGEVTTYTYNARGQPLTVTNPKNETTTFGYNADGYLLTVDGPLPGTADTVTYAYDGYGRVRTVTDTEGYAVTTDYDALNRPTLVTYPDATYQQIVYDKLDAAQTRDRRGRWSRMTYNPIRQLVAAEDPLGRVTRLAWCKCGALRAHVDPAGNATTWNHDVQGRLTAKNFPDGTKVDYTYEANTSRLKTITDALGQKTNLQYFNDDSLRQVSYTDATVATPTVSYTYDPYYPRAATMTDGFGTTAYTYNPVPVTPTLGAGRLAAIDGPLANDTLTYTYDALGRIVGSAINGSANASTLVYDALGRVTSATNPLGTFGYAYVNQTARLDHLDSPNGQRSNFSYANNLGDQRLQQIQNLRAGGANLSTFGYTYDAEGIIQTWSKQFDAAPALTSSFAYDLANQLVEALVPTAAGPTKRHLYRYDAASNRTSEQIDNGVTAATHNNLNQILALSPTGPIRIEGTVNEPAEVKVNGVTARVDAANKFSADVPLAPGAQPIAVVATDGSGNAATRNYQVTVAGGTARTLTHDLNGNLLNDGAGRTYAWDANNRLVKITQASGVTEFVYDGGSRRVQEKFNGALIKQWVWCGGAQPCEERDAANTVTKRFFGQGQLNGTTALFYTKDHLGSVREMTDTSGAIRARYDYDPYGRTTKVSGDLEADFGFTGFHRHQTSGLNLTLYRAYDADLGRWLSRDPIAENGGPNLYAYVTNDPINQMDPLGLMSKGDCAQFRQEIIRRGISLLSDIQRYNPLDDIGGHIYWAGGKLRVTKPWGHYDEIKGRQSGLKQDITRYVSECLKKCDDDDGPNPPLPEPLDRLVNKKIEEPTIPRPIIIVPFPMPRVPIPIPIPL
jgi:RHS repeat-associated protein